MLGGELSRLAASMPADLPPRSRLLLLSLACLTGADRETPRRFPVTRERLAERCGFSLQTLRRSLADLEGRGLVEVEAAGSGAVYRIVPNWNDALQIGTTDAPNWNSAPCYISNRRNQAVSDEAETEAAANARADFLAWWRTRGAAS